MDTSETASSATSPSVQTDKLLDLVLGAQASSANLLSAEKIKVSAEHLVEYALATGSPLLMPASAMAQRLVGAALLLSNGMLRAGDDSTVLGSKDVLLVEAVAAHPAGLIHQKERLFALGAKSVKVVALGCLADHSGIPVVLG